MEYEEPIGPGDSRIELTSDNSGRNVVHHDQPINRLRVVFGKSSCHTRTSIMTHQGHLGESECPHELEHIHGHRPFVVAVVWLFRLTISSQIGRDYTIVLG